MDGYVTLYGNDAEKLKDVGAFLRAKFQEVAEGPAAPGRNPRYRLGENSGSASLDNFTYAQPFSFTTEKFDDAASLAVRMAEALRRENIDVGVTMDEHYARGWRNEDGVFAQGFIIG